MLYEVITRLAGGKPPEGHAHREDPLRPPDGDRSVLGDLLCHFKGHLGKFLRRTGPVHQLEIVRPPRAHLPRRVEQFLRRGQPDRVDEPHETRRVITSYSIHYTKLYESRSSVIGPKP